MLKNELLKVGQQVVLISVGVSGLSLSENVVAEVEPNIVLASEYESGLRLSEYWMSEKLDGIRAIWTGQELLTRKGNHIHAPKWFTKMLPDFAVEGELWCGRGLFNVVQRTVLDHIPDEKAWAKVRFMLFDVPGAGQRDSFKQRYRELVHWVETVDAEHIGYVEQAEIASEHLLLAHLDSLVSAGGEGVMLRRAESFYRAGRNDDLIKVKRHQDAEARVIGYKPGTGKYEGLMGSVLVQLDDGRTFYIGSGFTDEQRVNPPAIGSTITYRFNGYTNNGLPRFARFMRIRQE